MKWYKDPITYLCLSIILVVVSMGMTFYSVRAEHCAQWAVVNGTPMEYKTFSGCVPVEVPKPQKLSEA